MRAPFVPYYIKIPLIVTVKKQKNPIPHDYLDIRTILLTNMHICAILLITIINKIAERVKPLIDSPKQIRNTKQRRHMHELMQSTDAHPNALWLYEQMKPHFPNLSLSTVYRNLGILEQQGLIQRLTCCPSFDRYDADITDHSHFHCRECNGVIDIDAEDIEKYALARVDRGGHTFERCSVTFSGVCNLCAKSTNELKTN